MTIRAYGSKALNNHDVFNNNKLTSIYICSPLYTVTEKQHQQLVKIFFQFPFFIMGNVAESIMSKSENIYKVYILVICYLFWIPYNSTIRINLQ